MDADDAAPLSFTFAARLGGKLLRGVWGLKISGLDHVPRSGPVILAGNHVSLMDGPLLGIAVSTLRFTRFFGKAELFRIPMLGWFLRNAGAAPIDRSRGDASAMRAALDILRRGGCLAWFPEGTRVKTGFPGIAKAGIGFLAGRSGAAVVPAHLVNTSRWTRLSPLEVRFGPALKFGGNPEDHDQCLNFAQDVMREVFAL